LKSSKPRFVADTMMGELARWLRIMGYDVVYSRYFSDKDLLRIASETDRIILTRDKRLHRRATKMGVKSVYVESVEGPAYRLAEVSAKAGIELEADPSKSRCPECNSELVSTSRESVAGRVPPVAGKTYHVFYLCPRCGRVYWEGSHWKNIRRIIGEARNLRNKLIGK